MPHTERLPLLRWPRKVSQGLFKVAPRRCVWGECGAPGSGLRAGGVEIPEDQRTSTSSDREDLDDARAHAVSPYRRHVMRAW